MPWTSPSDPVTSTVITVAYAVANLLTQIRWLRLMTGNADPPGSSYVVVADSVAATSWRKVPADALAAGAVVGNLGYTPVNQAGDGMSGTLSVLKTQGPVAGAFATAQLVAQSPDAALNPSETAGIGMHRTNASGVYLYHAGATAPNILRLITNAGAVGSVWSGLNQGSGSGLDADTLRTLVPGAAAGNLAVLGAGGKVALAVVLGRAEPPSQLPADPRQDQAEQDDADRVVDE